MKPNHVARVNANPQRRTILRGALITGCAIGLPLLWGCKPKDSTDTSTSTTAVPSTSNDAVTPASEMPSPTSSPSNTDSSAIDGSSATSGKMSKAMAQYQSQPKGEQQCSNCMHFLAESNACTLVEGQIEPQAWSILWAKRPS